MKAIIITCIVWAIVLGAVLWANFKFWSIAPDTEKEND